MDNYKYSIGDRLEREEAERYDAIADLQKATQVVLAKLRADAKRQGAPPPMVSTY